MGKCAAAMLNNELCKMTIPSIVAIRWSTSTKTRGRQRKFFASNVVCFLQRDSAVSYHLLLRVLYVCYYLACVCVCENYSILCVCLKVHDGEVEKCHGWKFRISPWGCQPVTRYHFSSPRPPAFQPPPGRCHAHIHTQKLQTRVRWKGRAEQERKWSQTLRHMFSNQS